MQNIVQLRQCGRRGTFTLKDESAVDKDAVLKALKKNNLDLASAEKVVRQRAQREVSFSFSKPPS